VEYLFALKHSLKIFWKSEHFARRYKRKRDQVFFSEQSVVMACLAGVEMGAGHGQQGKTK